MPTLRRSDGVLVLGNVSLAEVARDPRFGTPAYVYDVDAIAAEGRELRAAFDDAPHLVAYAVKANSAGPIVKALAAVGCGADVVSGAELTLALRCGVSPESVVFSGVAKTDAELDLAIGSGEHGICSIQVESVEEIPRIAARAAAAGRVARVSLRINPGVDKEALDTHSYIATGHDEAKFGVPLERPGGARARLALRRAPPRRSRFARRLSAHHRRRIRRVGARSVRARARGPRSLSAHVRRYRRRVRHRLR